MNLLSFDNLTRTYDRQGNPISFLEYVKLRKDSNYFQLKITEINDQKISTVWLGLNHQFGEGPPLIFETMIFGGEHDGRAWRYSTEAEAYAGHETVVIILQGTKRLPLP